MLGWCQVGGVDSGGYLGGKGGGFWCFFAVFVIYNQDIERIILFCHRGLFCAGKRGEGLGSQGRFSVLETVH